MKHEICFQHYCDTLKHYWRLVSEDGRSILAKSNTGFNTRKECLNDIEIFKKSEDAPPGTKDAPIDG